MTDGVKSVMISREVAATMGMKKRAATRKKQGGASIVRGVSEDMMAVKGMDSSVAANAGSTKSSEWLSYSSTTAPSHVMPPRTPVSMNPYPVSASETAAPTAMYRGEGGQIKNIRVELKKRESAKKVKLHPKKESKPIPKKSLTKKSRKITLGVASLHKRMTRAKKVQHTMKAMPIDKLKKLLIQKKLIKPTSKAPESILRQIAADSQIMEGKSL